MTANTELPMLTERHVRVLDSLDEMSYEDLTVLQEVLSVVRAIVSGSERQKCVECGKELQGKYPVPVICQNCHEAKGREAE